MSDTVTNPSIGRWALIVDDHPLFCDALELTLKSVADFTMVRTANSLAAALDELEGLPAPSIILLDLNLPDVSGLDGLLSLKRKSEKSEIIIVSSLTENAVINSAIAAGAETASRAMVLAAVLVKLDCIINPFDSQTNWAQHHSAN